MFMLLRLVCLICLLTVLSTRSATALSVRLADVKINGTINATAAYGVISGNDNGLLAQLNSDSVPMLAAWTPVTGLTWTALGKSDEASGGPFTDNVNSTIGTLT